ncbi:hypothetical protein NST77_23295 [Niallia sp. FSL W8-0177]|uniref:hypothetical protein n=1 Tax=Niallia TaxID=2837506 RepID=UPI002E250842|nr:hypothetical protein [Niallia circulans]
MSEFKCPLLPPTIDFNNYGVWDVYESYLYEIFVHDFIESQPYLFGKPVRFRKHPVVIDKEQAFFHITSVSTSKNVADPNDRIPDFRRCERIHWVKIILENYNCQKGCCSFIKYWAEPYKMYKRWHFLFEEVRFLVIVEEREDYMLLISSYYIEYDNQLRKKLKKYQQYK